VNFESKHQDELDVLIIGAGVSGIGAAWHLQHRHPGKSYAILESRHDLGGTWDLFRYPGIRSDSDLYTFGYQFKPWTDDKSIADGPAIKAYIRETAEENGIDRKIRFGHEVQRAEWSSEDSVWTLTVELAETGETFEMKARWIFAATGYYRYDEGYTPRFEGIDDFAGRVIHPQHWPEDFEYAGKRIVVIGSGATAVTLIPELAREAAQVTMLQRSPTYVLPVPEQDRIALALRRYLGESRAYRIIRRKNILKQKLVYQLSQRFPKLARRFIRSVNAKMLEGTDCDVDVHFNPGYDPWDQRLCAVPDGDFYRSIREGSASVVTDRIKSFTPTGISLESGDELEADVVVTATGLNVLVFGGIEVRVDGKEIRLPDTVAYKGMMLSDVPNLAFAIGYTNSSWTLKVDLVCEYFCRLLEHMDRIGVDSATVRVNDPGMERVPLLDFKAGYVLRALDGLPRQGTEAPWHLAQNYARDSRFLRHGKVADQQTEFRRSGRKVADRERIPA
jgi:cation diffusion facilitator CzcD-associated flavoprotein CzcO